MLLSAAEFIIASTNSNLGFTAFGPVCAPIIINPTKVNFDMLKKRFKGNVLYRCIILVQVTNPRGAELPVNRNAYPTIVRHVPIRQFLGAFGKYLEIIKSKKRTLPSLFRLKLRTEPRCGLYNTEHLPCPFFLDTIAE